MILIVNINILFPLNIPRVGGRIIMMKKIQ